MKDLSDTLGALWRTASQAGPAGGGRAVMFVASGPSVDLASLTASFALMCADRSNRPVWLLDLDFRENPLFAAFDSGFAGESSLPGRAFDTRLSGYPLYCSATGQAVSTKGGVDPDKLLALHVITGTNLLVSRFRTEALAQGQKLVLQRRSSWWNAARQKADWIIVHAPPTQTSGAALSFARDVDGVIMAVEADRTRVDDAAQLRGDVEAEGGQLIGSVMTGVRADSRLIGRLAA